jgi:hypothetical protein
VAERKNRSLKEMVGCMIHTHSLTPMYWEEDINYAAHIQNRVPHKVLKGITPVEAWCGRKLVVRHFRDFQSLIWTHIPSKKCKALKSKVQPCISVGYPNGVKGYKLLDPETHELFIECNALQFENISPSLSSHIPSSIADSDSDSEDFPPDASTCKFDHEVSSSSL